jgi:outer membrane receptor protein involved in Fe transport
VGVRAFSDRLQRYQAIGGTLFAPTVTSSTVDESSVTPKFNLSYHLSPVSMLYFQAAKGYRIGQTNSVTEDPFTHTPIPAASSPDSLWSYEAGEKSTFFNGHLLVNASIYHIDWSNIQLNQLSPSGINFIGNAGEAHIDGFELQVQARLSREWDLGGSLSLSHARLDSVNPTVAATKGDQLPGSAPFTGVIYAAYTHPLGNADLFARIDARWVGKEYSDLNNSTSLTFGDYSTVNIRTGINWDRYSATLFLDNVTNDDSKTSAVEFAGQRAAIRQRPFTLGVTLDARF